MIDDNKLIEYFLGILCQIKVFHWATTHYSKHKALDDLHSSLSSKVDTLVECYIGRYKKQPLKAFKISMSAHSDLTKIDTFLESERETIRKLSPQFKTASEIQSIIDDILMLFNQAIYLCNLK